MSVKIPKDKQAELVLMIQDTFGNYKMMLNNWRSRMIEIYDAYQKYTGEKQADRQTNFWINKSFETVNKVTPRILSKNPRLIVNVRTDSFYFQNIIRNDAESINKLNINAQALQDYLNVLFKDQKFYDKIKIWAKNQVTYGLGFAKTSYVYETFGGKVIGEKPSIDIKSWVDIYYDPRYKFLDDMPALIEVKTKVRKADIMRNKDKYFNLDILDKVIGVTEGIEDHDSFRTQIHSLTGINISNDQKGVNKDDLILKIYYGFANLGKNPEDEKLYEIVTINDLIMIGMEEIEEYPFEVIKAFEDPEVFRATGFIEKILGIEKELNFKKNSKADYINHSLNRSWIWSPQSGVNPSDLLSRPNGIIPTNKTVAEALNNMVELPHRTLPNDYFAEGNEMERDLQNLTFLVDTSNPRNQSALTNTATGARIKFFESNIVLNEIRRNFENGLERMAYKLLQETFRRMDKNIIIKKLDGTGYWDINKKALEEAVQKYRISIEANSSTFESVEERRNDAIAKVNIGLQLAQAGVPINFEELARSVYQTFEDKDPDKYISPQPLPMGGQEGGGGGGKITTEEGGAKNEAALLTEQIAKGGLTNLQS